MTVKYAETFERWTPDDVEHGEPSETGFEWEETSDTFTDMIEILRFAEVSQYPIPLRPDSTVWFTVHDWGNGTIEYFEDGLTENRSYHPKTNRDARYMLKAWKQTH